MAEPDIDEVMCNIRSVILSHKGPISLRELARDYETLALESIPFRTFQFSTLEDFLRSQRSLAVCGSGAHATVKAAGSSASQHVSEMVARQKSAKKPSRGTFPFIPSYRGRGGRSRGRGYGYTPRPYARVNNYSRERYPQEEDWENSASSSNTSFWSTSNRSSPPPKRFSPPPKRPFPSSRRPSPPSQRRQGPSPPLSRTSPPSQRRQGPSPPLSRTSPPSQRRQGPSPPLSRTSPPSQRRQDHRGDFTVNVNGNDRKVTLKERYEIPPRLQKSKEKAISPEPEPRTSPTHDPQMVFEIHCLGSLQAKHLIANMHGNSSSKIIIPQFFECPGLNLKNIKLKVMENRPRFDAKIPLLIMVGEIDVMMTTEKIKDIKKDYLALIFSLRELFQGIKLILVHLPICICMYQNQSHLERARSFNEFLSNGLQNHANGIFVLCLQREFDKIEYFNCFNKKNKANLDSHITETGYSTLAALLSTRLEQGFDSSLFFDQTSSAANSASIICPLGPGQLVAKGRKQQAEKAQQQFSASLNMALQPSFQQTNGLHADFAHITHNDLVAAPLGTPLLTPANGRLEMAEDSQVDSLLEADMNCVSKNIAKLKSYCAIRGWSEPSYTLVTPKNRSHPPVYLANVKGGEGENCFSMSSFPFENADPLIVKGYAAAKALDKILKEESKKVISDIVISSDKNIICNRISKIVAGTLTGMFADSVGDEYLKRYNEKLPSDWQQIVLQWPLLAVEKTLNSTIIVPREPLPELLSTYPPPELSIELLGNNEDQSEGVYITNASSTNNIYFRVIGKEYSEEYEALLEQMDVYYSGVGKQDLALALEVGQYYAAHSANTWFRVCVMEVDETRQQAVAWLLDLGSVERFQFGSLYRLSPQFCQLPRQAVLFTLEGLEMFSDDPLANEVVSSSEMLYGNTLIAKISQKDLENSYVTGTLYDTSGEDDINVNEQIKDEILVKMKPEMPAENRSIEVGIGHVSKKGEVYVIFIGPALERIIQLLDSLEPEMSKHKLTSFKHISLDKFYLAKYSLDNKWYRAVVTNTPSVQQNKIPVRFVDYGNTESVSINNMADLENLPPILRKLAPQAMKVALHNLPIASLTNPEVARLHSLLMDEEKAILIKTVSLKADPPIVEIFTNNEGGLQSVNKAIELQRNLMRTEQNGFDLNTNVNQLKLDDDVFGLVCPEITPYEAVEVEVVLPAHPGHFILGKYRTQLLKLRDEMNAYYQSNDLPELNNSEVEKSKLYAARYSKDCWYRVLVTGSVAGNRVAVRFIDFGDVVCVPLSSLRDLPFFFQKYPFMAIKGQLAGVKPRHQDWAVEDCMRFRELVSDRVLTGTVVGLIENKEKPMEMTVTLSLLAKENDKSQNIADILMTEHRAVRL